MRNIIVMASAGLALCGCATDPSVGQMAALNCQSVGISEKDPQFATRSKAFSQQYLEDQLEKAVVS